MNSNEEVLPGSISVETQTLLEIGRLLTIELNLEKLVEAATDAATKLVGAQFGAFFYNVINEKGESYMLYTIAGVPREAFSKFPMPRNTAVFSPTFNGDGPVRSADIRKDPRYGKNAPHQGMPEGHLPVVSYLAVPVLSRSGAVLGGLFFGHGLSGKFTEHHEEIAISLAAQAGVAIENAQLYQAVRTSENQFKQLANAMPQLAWMANPDGYIFWYNERWYEYTGKTPDEMVGWGWQSVHDPQSLPEVLYQWNHSISTGVPFEMIFPLRDRNGDFRSFLTRVVPLRDGNGIITRWFGTNTDISTQQRAEEALRQSEKLAVVGRMAASIAHEINNPLEAVTNLFYLLENHVDQKGAEYLKTAQQELLRVSSITKRTLGFYRDNEKPESTDINLIILEVLTLLRSKFTAKGIQSDYDIQTAHFWGNRGEIRQVLLNLLSNAVDAVEQGGKIYLKSELHRDTLLVSIRDNGPGIPIEFHEKVFQPFFSTKKEVGTGLGLWISRDLVVKNNGLLTFESPLGPEGGTVFHLSLPSSGN